MDTEIQNITITCVCIPSVSFHFLKMSRFHVLGMNNERVFAFLIRKDCVPTSRLFQMKKVSKIQLEMLQLKGCFLTWDYPPIIYNPCMVLKNIIA